jgi:hypothetical protein
MNTKKATNNPISIIAEHVGWDSPNYSVAVDVIDHLRRHGFVIVELNEDTASMAIDTSDTDIPK